MVGAIGGPHPAFGHPHLAFVAVLGSLRKLGLDRMLSAVPVRNATLTRPSATLTRPSATLSQRERG